MCDEIYGPPLNDGLIGKKGNITNDSNCKKINKNTMSRAHMASTSPPPLPVAKTGKIHLNEEITPLLPAGIGERFSQNKYNLGHAALLRRCELLL